MVAAGKLALDDRLGDPEVVLVLAQLDVELISSLAAEIPRVITVEENALQGGFGSAVLEALMGAGITGVRVERIGVADTFVEHGPQQLLRSLYGIDASAIVKTAVRMMAGA